MYLYSFLYPRPKSRRFDYDHHLNVHMPLGLFLSKKHLGIEPAYFWIERIDEDNPASQEPYAAVVHLAFESKEDRDRLSDMVNVPEAAELSADYANYTDAPPLVRKSRMVAENNISALIFRVGQSRESGSQ